MKVLTSPVWISPSMEAWRRSDLVADLVAVPWLALPLRQSSDHPSKTLLLTPRSEKQHELCNCRIRKDRPAPPPRICPSQYQRDCREPPAARGVGASGSGGWTHGRRQVAAGCARGR